MQRLEGRDVCSQDVEIRHLFLGCWEEVVTSLTLLVHVSKEVGCWASICGLGSTVLFSYYDDGKISMCSAVLEYSSYVNFLLSFLNKSFSGEQ